MKTRIVNVLACAVLLTALTDLAQAGETPTPPNDESALDPLYLKHLEEIGDPYLPPTHDPDLRSAGRSTWTVGNFTSVQVNVDQFGDNIPGDAANEPSIAVDPTNPNRMVIGWRQFDTIASNFRQSGWAYSHDGGLTWTFPGVLRPGEFASDPVLDSDLDGNFYYYSLQPGRGPGDWACYLYKSFDGGVTWPQDVYGWGGDKEWMVIDKTGGIGSGNVYTTWNVAFSCCTEDFARSVNGGLSFPAMEKMPLNIHWGTLSVGPDGELYVSGENFWVARSLSAQDPFAAPVFETWSFVDLGGDIGGVGGGDPNPGGLLGQAWVATDHSTGVNRGNVYLLCSVDVPGADPRDVMFSRSTDGGFTWSPPVRVNDVADGW
ncbi:MAG: exo-alpha-sialidase, partial [bacterium]|nr:exo-alpha-sialidase [bacterium]